MSRRKKAVDAAPSEPTTPALIGPVALAFVGDGRRYVPGVPAADVVIEDGSEAERLIETGLYVLAEGTRAAAAPAQQDPANDGSAGE